MSEGFGEESQAMRDSTWPVPHIDPTVCDGCGLCVVVCPTNALSLCGGLAIVAFPDRCNYTGLCEQACPQSAIQRVFEITWTDGLSSE